jgi:predicted acylesterase/phospholipase RssA
MALNVFIKSLIENIPNNHIPKNIDLVLDGGAFNGIYMLGSLFYIKELERREKINIKRISGCSIGAVLGLLFLLNKMEISIEISTLAFKCLRKHQHLKKLIMVIKQKFNEIVILIQMMGNKL